MNKPWITHPDDRAIVATFLGAFALGFFHAIAPARDTSSVTLARQGDTAIVIDTLARNDSTDPGVVASQSPPLADSSAVITASDSSFVTSLRVAGSSTPAVVPADIDMLRRTSPVVPVAGVTVDKLDDTFDAGRGGGRRHNALDIMAARNTPVVSAADGVVLKLHTSVAGGLTIYVADRTQRYIFLYGHLESYRPGLRDGAAVKRGEILGFVGSSGNANPAGPHLHFQVTRSDNMKEWWKGTPLNPFLVYRGK